ncbi:Signal recognition particle [Pleurotus ostreatus]|nr:Signal recognition particle [Pleurotus ostreatus]
MVLADLGRKLNAALSSLNRAPVVDEKVLDATLKEITAALLESDVNVKLVASLRQKVKVKVKAALEGGDKSKETNRKHLIQKAVFDELVNLVDPGVEPYKPKKGQSNVIMAVGLQGNGKTTTCTKLAVHYQKRGLDLLLSALIPSVLVLSIKHDSRRPRPKSLTSARIRKRTP